MYIRTLINPDLKQTSKNYLLYKKPLISGFSDVLISHFPRIRDANFHSAKVELLSCTINKYHYMTPYCKAYNGIIMVDALHAYTKLGTVQNYKPQISTGLKTQQS